MEGARTACIVIIGTLMIIYAALGGMRGTALIQMIKIVILLGTSAVVAALVLNRFAWSPGNVLRAAQQGSGAGPAFLQQGLQLGTSAIDRLDFISLQITVVLGVACLPHVTMRLYSARDVPTVRRSMSWAVGTVTTFCLLVIIMGTGAAALVGSQYITAADPRAGRRCSCCRRCSAGHTVPRAPRCSTRPWRAWCSSPCCRRSRA
ncbi:hypothetical protein OG895_00805 [Streptomyces sp. NBC_00201]|uniref:sodium:solute symporter family transporter n=1 Tax=Streptomyces sp. NBC_00201 TaxID=2975679 RepID=UPI0022517314|nr:hypothetical protein [Streptomyces sp. NBC_00201]MCX5243794.1 hypothetical protein [Streptomyces sp. NBC_00201]